MRGLGTVSVLRRAILAATLAGAAPLGVGPARAEPPSIQTAIHANARLALREDRPLDAVRLWFLRTAVENRTERISPHDGDFHSITWVALGELGVCQDGLRHDTDGAGLWPLAMLNHLIRTRSRGPSGDRSRPFRAFEADRQQRNVTIDDVLGTEELRTLSLIRGPCLGPVFGILAAGGAITERVRDREVAVRVMQFLIERAQVTLGDQVRGQSVLDARAFDLHLREIADARARARREVRGLARLGRDLGLSRTSARVIREDGRDFAFTDDSEAADILREAATWDAPAWMALSPDRRLYLFDQTNRYLEQPASLDAARLGIIDALIAEGDGEAVEAWIARHPHPIDVWSGERGQRLLALDADSGFTERGPVALHRGARALESGDLDRALQNFAYAVQVAPTSDRPAEVEGLALRWLAYVVAQFELTEDLLLTLQELLPRRAYTRVLEDLLWSAAFRADAPSFTRGMDHQLGRGASGRRFERLAPLARGDGQAFTRRIATDLAEAPGEAFRFLGEYLERLELEDAGVRAAQRPVLDRIRATLEPHADPSGGRRRARRATALLDRSLALLDGLGASAATSPRDAARRLDPRAEVFAGRVRLAPSDPLPWPFQASPVDSPGVFVPLELRPIEWRDADGSWIYGWAIEG